MEVQLTSLFKSGKARGDRVRNKKYESSVKLQTLLNLSEDGKENGTIIF